MSYDKTIYVTDLDGTLLNRESVISEHSRELLNLLTANGALITFATARTPATVTDIFRDVNLKLPGIVMTGAALFDLSAGVYRDMKFLNADIAVNSLKVFEENGINAFMYSWHPDNILHAYHPNGLEDYEKSFYELRRNKCLKKFHINEVPKIWDLEHCLLIFSIGLRRNIESLTERLSETVGYPVTYYNDIFSPEYGFIEIFAKDVSKAGAIIKLKEEYNADRIVAFGDNLNDIPMFEVADFSVAVENSFKEVKEKANIVIGPNYSDSVVDFIFNDFFSKKS